MFDIQRFLLGQCTVSLVPTFPLSISTGHDHPSSKVSERVHDLMTILSDNLTLSLFVPHERLGQFTYPTYLSAHRDQRWKKHGHSSGTSCYTIFSRSAPSPRHSALLKIAWAVSIFVAMSPDYKARGERTGRCFSPGLTTPLSLSRCSSHCPSPPPWLPPPQLTPLSRPCGSMVATKVSSRMMYVDHTLKI